MITRQRNQTIDLLRFLFSVVIVIHHSRYLLGDENSMFLGGSLAVEFFFLVSGYLMMATIAKKNRDDTGACIPKETFGYLKHKLRSFYPEVMLAWFVGFLFASMASWDGIKEVAKRFLNCFAEAFLLFSFGMSTKNVNPATWYLSSMLIFMVILYPLLRKYPAAMKYLVMPLSAMFLLGWLCMEDKHPRNPTKWLGFTYKGNLRALAELELGALCFFATQKIRKLSFNRWGKWILTAVEVSCYVVSVLYMFYETPSQRDLFFILLLCLGVCLSFSGQTLLINLPESRLIFWLGKFSFPLYLCHYYYAVNLNNILPQSFTNNQRMTVYLICAFVTALVVWGISTLLRKNGDRILAFFKRLFLQEPALNA